MTESTWQSLQQSADWARKAADHEKAVDLYTQALSQPDIPWKTFVDMSMACAYSYRMLGQRASADASLTGLAEKALQRGDEPVMIRAYAELLFVLRNSPELKRGLQFAQVALQAAERIGQPDLIAEALLSMGVIHIDLGEYKEAQACLTEAQRFIEPEDKPKRLKAHFIKDFLLGKSGKYQEMESSTRQALEIARSIGDRDWEGKLLNQLAIYTSDITLRRSYYEQALTAFEAAGDQPYQVLVRFNNGTDDISLGLYQRAIEYIQPLMVRDRAMGDDFSCCYDLIQLGLAVFYLGDLQAAIHFLKEGLELAHELGLIRMELNFQSLLGNCFTLLEQPEAALEASHAADTLPYQQDKDERLLLMAWQSNASILVGDHPAAQKQVGEALTILKEMDDMTSGYGSTDYVCWYYYRALLPPKAATGKGRPISAKAWRVLELGLKYMLIPIKNMSDAGLRRGYLHRNPFHRQQILEWLKQAPVHAVGTEKMDAFTAQVQKPGRLDEVFHRLLKVGVHLNVQRDPSRLPEEIMEEVDELTGAERIALILVDEQGKRRLIKTLLPRPFFTVVTGEIETPPDQEAFLSEIESWVEEAIFARQGFIRQLNPDGRLTEQRSVLVTPLISHGRLVGMIYCDLRGCFGRFDPEDLNLLGVLANQSAVALENADWSATLEKKVTDRTAELKQSNNRLEQRTAELTIINRVQEGLVKQLDFQAIIDLVGDEIMRVFPAPKRKAGLYSVFIALYDPQTNLIQFPYCMSGLGERLYPRPNVLGPGLTSKVIQSRHPQLLKTWEEQISNGGIMFEDGFPNEFSHSWLGVPILSGDRVTGVINLQDPRKDHFTQSDVRLLSTLAASLGVSLENARLFDETQRLLKETEQRNAELAIINSVQAALASELNIQGIYDVVGDKIREIFHNDSISIRIYDPKTTLLHFPYLYEDGKRITLESQPFTLIGFTGYVLRFRETLVINQDMAQAIEQYGSFVYPGTKNDKSAVYVPLIAGDEARGLVSMSNFEREHAFSDSDVRLLQTLVNSMSVALENARLFNETQRLFKAEQERVAELQIINSIQQGLAAELDFQAIVDLVGDKLREVFKTPDLSIVWYDEKANQLYQMYTYEHGQRLSVPPNKPTPNGAFMRMSQTHQPVIWNTAEEGDELTGGVIPGTDRSISGVRIPIISSDRVLGAITLENYEREHAYGEAELRLLSTIAGSLGSALENARLFDETQRLLKETEQRNAELAIINSVQAALSAELSIQGIYDGVGDKIRAIFKSGNVDIRIYDPQTNIISFPFDYENGQRFNLEPMLLPEKGFAAHVIRTRETLVINENMKQAMEMYGSYVLPGTLEDKSSVWVPLVVGGQARGLVCLSDYEHENAFSDSDVRLLQTLVNSMSVALENARLFDETQRLLKETKQRNSELAIINSVQAALAAELNIQGIYDAVGDKIREIFHSDNLEIRIFDPNTNLELFPYLYEKGERIEQEPLPRIPTGFGAHVARSRETLVINQDMLENVQKYGSILVPGTDFSKSAVYVPLIVGDQVRGLIVLSDFEREHAFSDSDVRLLQTLVNSMSVALENARLFAETQRLLDETSQRATELSIINSVSQSMSSQLQVEAIVRTVGDQIRDTLHSEVVNIYLFDAVSKMIHLPYSYDRKYVETEPFPYGPGLTSKVIDLKQPLILGSFEEITGGGALLNPNSPGDELMPQSYLGVPIVIGDKAIGAIDVQSYTRFVYNESHIRLLSTLASSMGVALENARLFEETRRLLAETEQRNRELAIISRIGQALAGQLDPQGIFELVGAELQQVFDAQMVGIITYNQQEDLVSWRYSVEKGQRQDIPPHTPGGFSGHILRTREPILITHDIAERADEYGSTVLAGELPKSYLGVPLIAGGEVTGVITLQNIDHEGAFTENDLRLLSTLALSMGVALENARLYQETQHHAVEMAALAEIGSDIASTHEMEPVLERMATKTRELMQVRDIALYLLQPDGHTLKPIVSQGKYALETMAQTIMMGEGMTGDVAQRGIAEIINEPESDLRAIHIEGTPPEENELECLMIAPLISRGRVIGIMSVYRDRNQGLFTQLELDFLDSLARQAAIAIESARLYAETERRATEMAALAEVSREISATLELQVVLERIAGKARELLAAGTSAVYLLQADGVTIKAIAALGEITQEVLADEVQLGTGIIGSIVKSGMAEWIDDTGKDSRGVHIPGTEETPEGEKLLVAPLLVQDRAIGALAVWRGPDNPTFNQAELSFSIGLAQQAAVAIENARLFESAQESQRRMADIINFLPDATFVVDREGKVIAWNHAIEEMTGVKAVDILGKSNYEYALPFYGERRPILIDTVLLPDEEIEAKYAHIQRNEGILIGEAVVPQLKDRTAYLNATASALKNSKGEAIGAIESIRDITDQKRAEQELNQAKAEAEAANQAKSAFLAMMSHEIRTPMNAIIGMSGLLMDTTLTPDQYEFAETIRSSGDSLLTIINDILDFSKIEAGKMTLEESPFDLRECIEASLDLIKVKASEKGLELAYQMEPEVPPAILGDVTRLRQVLINLLGNSVKFTEQGEIVLMVSKGDEQDSLHFSVRDTGIGISPDRVSLLFRPFTQADASTSRRYGGTGLGLALSSRIVDLMGGKMWVESEGIPGKGSTFHFIIFTKSVPDWIGRPHTQGEHPQLRGRRVLLVDDNATNRRILELQTQTWGMLPRECSSAAEALEVLRQGDRFDLAILDMHMPESSGMELADEIRKLEASRPGSAQMTLVLSTSLGGREEAREFTEFAAVLMKPIRQSALFDLLMTLLSDRTETTIKPVAEPAVLDPEMASRHPLRILLAEDNVVNQKLAMRLLSQMGYRADVAANGLEVLEAVKRQTYDAILMDVQMPEMDGLEATRHLCAEYSVGKRPRIIAMTANAMQGDREMCLEAGMDDYLSKPIRVEELVNALRLTKPLSNG